MDDVATARDLYHYTSAGGLQGILASSTIYGTHIAYLNDANEIRYGVDAMKTIFSPSSGLMAMSSIGIDEYMESVRKVLARLQREVRDQLQDERQYPFVTCFSAEEDQLSQWRGYAHDGGYAIRFESELLQNSIWRDLKEGDSRPARGEHTEERYDLNRVAYGVDQAERYVENVFDTLIPAIMRQQDELPYSGRDRLGLEYELALIQLREITALIKDPAFEEEREYRVTAYIPHALRDQPCFLHSASRIGLIPRVKLRFDPRCITQIVVGPGEYMEIRRKSVADFIEAHRNDYPMADVVTSVVPFRAT